MLPGGLISTNLSLAYSTPDIPASLLVLKNAWHSIPYTPCKHFTCHTLPEHYYFTLVKKQLP